jgi:hypothetical protein
MVNEGNLTVSQVCQNDNKNAILRGVRWLMAGMLRQPPISDQKIIKRLETTITIRNAMAARK